MLDDILQALVQGYLGSRTPSERWRKLARLFFGLLGAGLSFAGAVVIVGRERTASLPLRFSFLLLFIGFGSIWLFNVALARKWRWPAVLLFVSLPLIFFVRIVLGP